MLETVLPPLSKTSKYGQIGGVACPARSVALSARLDMDTRRLMVTSKPESTIRLRAGPQLRVCLAR